MTVIVIGGGAAGMIAAGTAAKYADKVIIIEKNNLFGKKLLITGKGRCNITNAADLEDMIQMYPTNGKFLYSALYSFTNQDIVDLIESYGVKTKVERGGRVFPVSDRSQDVVKALKKYALQYNVKIFFTHARHIMVENGRVVGVRTDWGVTKADKVIICTGGQSYPQTGSTGDGYKFAKKMGHEIIPLRPSLVPIETEETWVKELMGLSLRNVSIRAYNSKNRCVYEDFGEMLFTHFGISGPIVLSMSTHLKPDEKYRISIDLKPGMNDAIIDARLIRDFKIRGKKHFINSLDELLPKKIIPVVVRLSGINEHKAACELTREERQRLIEVLKNFTLTFKKFRPLKEAIVTSGGVSVSDINPSTMESKKVKGVYFAGEVIDVDGYTGGYNLQAAFSTGYLAGLNAAKEE